MSPLPLNLVHVASGDLWAGAEVQLWYLARALAARPGVRLQVILLNHGELEWRLHGDGIPVEVLNEKSIGPLQLTAELRRRLLASGAQVVHSHRYKENILSAAAARGTGCVAVRSIHSLPEPPRGLRARAVRLADAVGARWQQAGICVSPELPAQVQQCFPHLPLEVIENGIDFDELATRAAAPVDESRFGRGLRVAFVGRLVEVKRPDIFVAAAHRLTHELPGQLSFHLFGDGPLESVCSEFVTRHGLGAQVRLLGFQSNLPAWLARCDALVLCSDHEGLPMVLLEAMGLGVPVIAHAVGGMPHVLEAGRLGTLVREQSPEAYVAALRAFADAPAAARQRAEQARRQVRARYAIDVVVDRYLDFYGRVLGRLPATLPLVSSGGAR